MEVINDALKYVVQAKHIILCDTIECDCCEQMMMEVVHLLEEAEEALVKAK